MLKIFENGIRNMHEEDEDFQPLDTREFFNNPRVMEEAMKQSWEDGNIEGALRFLIRLTKLKESLI